MPENRDGPLTAKRAIVRVLVFLTAALCVAIPIYPQADHQSKKDDDLYWLALTASVREMEKQWGKLDIAGDNRIRTDYRNMPVLQNREITDNLPTVSGPYRFTFLNHSALLQRFRARQKEYAVLEVHPAHNDGPRLRIEVSLSWVSDLNGTLMFGVSDWSEVEFVFDCKKQAYVVSAVKLGGI